MTILFALIGCAILAVLAWLFCIITAPYGEENR